MAFTVLTAEKHTPKISEKNSVEKFGEIIPFFGAFFGAFFGTFFGAFFGEPPFASKSEKFVQNPFCKRDPLTKYPPYRETAVAIPLSHCVSCGIADYRCYTPTSFCKNSLSQSKTET